MVPTFLGGAHTERVQNYVISQRFNQLDSLKNQYGLLLWWQSTDGTRKPLSQLEQLSNSYCNGGLNMWSNSYRFAERMYDPILPIPLLSLILPIPPIFHTHISTTTCMIAISAYMTVYSGVQWYMIVYSSVSSAFSAPNAVSRDSSPSIPCYLHCFLLPMHTLPPPSLLPPVSTSSLPPCLVIRIGTPCRVAYALSNAGAGMLRCNMKSPCREDISSI